MRQRILAILLTSSTLLLRLWADNPEGSTAVRNTHMNTSVPAPSLSAPASLTPPLAITNLRVPSDPTRTLTVGDQKRTYLVHLPPQYDPAKPTPVVLALHGAAMNGRMMVAFCGLNETADEAGFIVVYPSGTGTGPFLTWNAGGVKWRANQARPDDVEFISRLLDDLATIANVNPKRIYACGMSNGAMMCYRLAAELSDRIAAIAPVAGTMAIDNVHPKRPVPVIHFHGTQDTFVPFTRTENRTPAFINLKGVEETIQAWVSLNGCKEKPVIDVLSQEGEEMKVTRKTYPGGKDGAEVVLITIDGGGHTWPGRTPIVSFIGKSATNISANKLIGEFFQKHSLK
jgi:polyhydroxybutyrate depolymerase